MITKVKIISAMFIEDLEKEINSFLSKDGQIEKIIGITFIETTKRIKACIHYTKAKPKTEPTLLDQVLIDTLPIFIQMLDGFYQEALKKVLKPEPLPKNNNYN